MAEKNGPEQSRLQRDGESSSRWTTVRGDSAGHAGRETIATVTVDRGHSSRPDEALRQRLHELGGESDTERSVKRVLPFVASALIHLGVILIAIVAASTVILLRSDKEPTRIVADFDDLRYEPVVRRDMERGEPVERIVQDRVPVESLTEPINEQLMDITVDPLSVISDASAKSPLADFAPDPTTSRVEFSGLSSTNARRIVYVIDASGSMIRSLQIIVKELARSIDALSPQQQVGIVFFQGSDALIVPPVGELTPATGAAKLSMLQWIDRNVFPRGNSNPLAALEYALQSKPDVIFLLSENITGAGQYEIDQRDLLTMLEQMNPVIDDATGRRQTQINCIQFIADDPLDTLKRVAELHGGPRGYKFLDSEELGLAAPNR